MERLLGRRLRVGSVDVGTVTDVLASRRLDYVLGLEIRGRDGHGHFVPWVAAVVEPDTLTLTSVFSLLSSSELAVYVDNGLRLRECAPDAEVDREGLLAGPTGATATRRSISSVHALAKRSIP